MNSWSNCLIVSECFLAVMLAFPTSPHAADIKINDNTPLAGQTWANLQTILANTVSNDVIRISGNLAAGGGTGLVMSNAFVTLSGGWDSTFATQAWRDRSKGRLTNEPPFYSILNFQGSSGHRGRVLTISGTATNAKVDGFTITGAWLGYEGGAGVRVSAPGVRLSHLNVANNVDACNGAGTGSISVLGSGAVLEYLTVANNTTGGADGGYPTTGGIFASNSVLIANCWIADNVCNGGNSTHPGLYGSVVCFDPAATGPTDFALFGSVVRNNPAGSLGLAIGLYGTGNRHDYLVNCTAVDNTPYGRVGHQTYMISGRTNNYLINNILADTTGTFTDSGNGLNFQNTLIDPETPASGYYFDGVGNRDLGGNVTNQQPLFVDQAGKDYLLQEASPAMGAGLFRWDTTDGRKFAYVDLDRNGAYDQGLDIIVDASNYQPVSADRFYPTDMNGSKWLSRKTCGINMGAFGIPPGPRGTVVMIR